MRSAKEKENALLSVFLTRGIRISLSALREMRSRNSKLQKQPHKLDISWFHSAVLHFLWIQTQFDWIHTYGVSLSQLLLTSILDPQMTDCLREEEVKDPYPMTTSCSLQIHVVQVNQDHQTETETVFKMLDSSNKSLICFHHQCPYKTGSLMSVPTYILWIGLISIFYEISNTSPYTEITQLVRGD